MKRPRMWMECGVWPPPVRAQWRPSGREVRRRRRWIAAAIVAAMAFGGVMGCLVTLALTGEAVLA